MDGCARQNPAYRLATERPRFGGAFLFGLARERHLPALAAPDAAGDAGERQGGVQLLELAQLRSVLRLGRERRRVGVGLGDVGGVRGDGDRALAEAGAARLGCRDDDLAGAAARRAHGQREGEAGLRDQLRDRGGGLGRNRHGERARVVGARVGRRARVHALALLGGADHVAGIGRDDVRAVAAGDLVDLAVAAVDHVAAAVAVVVERAVALDPVPAGATADGVGPGAADDNVRAVVAEDVVVASTALDDVVAGAAVDGVRRRRARDR